MKKIRENLEKVQQKLRESSTEVKRKFNRKLERIYKKAGAIISPCFEFPWNSLEQLGNYTHIMTHKKFQKEANRKNQKQQEKL